MKRVKVDYSFKAISFFLPHYRDSALIQAAFEMDEPHTTWFALLNRFASIHLSCNEYHQLLQFQTELYFNLDFMKKKKKRKSKSYIFTNYNHNLLPWFYYNSFVLCSSFPRCAFFYFVDFCLTVQLFYRFAFVAWI